MDDSNDLANLPPDAADKVRAALQSMLGRDVDPQVAQALSPKEAQQTNMLQTDPDTGEGSAVPYYLSKEQEEQPLQAPPSSQLFEDTEGKAAAGAQGSALQPEATQAEEKVPD